MILDFQYSGKNNQIIISEIDPNGNVQLNYYPWKNPKRFVPCDSSDPNKHQLYTTWDKRPVKLESTTRPNRFSIYEFIDRLPRTEQDRLFKLQVPKVFFMDIETEILPSGFVEPKDASSRVLTVAVVHKENVWVLGLKPLSNEQSSRIKHDIEAHFSKFDLKCNFKYVSFDGYENSEKEMLLYLFEKLIPKMAVISGWNFLDYDWTFLVNRARRLDIKPEITSLTNKLETVFGTEHELPAHRLIVDYMQIYKKWDTSVKVKESNSLDWVGEKLVGLRKVHYDGGLQDLYDNDFEKYVFYNAVDTILVQLIHEKTRLMDIMFAISNLAKIRLCDFGYKNLNTTLVVSEGFLRTDFRNKKNIVFCKDDEDGDIDSIPGGLVKVPNRGMNEWVTTYDFSSLYPTIIRQFMIAPENFKGVQMKDNPGFAVYNSKITKIEETDIICNTGSVFSNEQSVTVDFLSDVFIRRKQAKKLMEKDQKELKDVKLEIKRLQQKLLDLDK